MEKSPRNNGDMDLRAVADGLLDDLRKLSDVVDRAKGEAQAEIEEVVGRHKPRIERFSEILKEREAELIAFMKAHKIEFFEHTDHVALTNGLLLHGEELKVKIPRDALSQIEAQGWLEAVKVAKSVDREVVEKWPVERLAAIGASRRAVETFTYEIKK